MKTLLEQAGDAESLLKAIRSLDQREAEFAALNERRDAIAGVVKELDNACQRISMYREAGLESKEVLPISIRTIERTREMLTRFKEVPSSQTLTAGRHWRTLLDDLVKTISAAESSAETSWNAFYQECLKVAPQDIEGRLPPSAENLRAMEAYKAVHKRLTELLRIQPQCAAVIAEIRATVTEINNRYAEIDFNYPPEVTAFLRAAAAQGASIGMLTQAVLDWLRERKLLDKYIVRNR
jgi:2-methylisocitrate lyase-like PEP mutase family enzyme